MVQTIFQLSPSSLGALSLSAIPYFTLNSWPYLTDVSWPSFFFWRHWSVQFLNCSLCFSLPLPSHPHSDPFWNDIARSKSWLPPVIKVIAKSDKNHIWSFKTLAKIPRRYKTTTFIHPSTHFLPLIWQTGLKECGKKKRTRQMLWLNAAHSLPVVQLISLHLYFQITLG